MRLFYVAEMTLQELLLKCPEFKKSLPDSIDIYDTNYIARIANDGSIEVGYPEDYWLLSPLS